MLIAQLSDIHIGCGPFGGNAARLAASVAEIGRRDPDVVLVTGDLTEDAEPASYREVAELLSPLAGKLLIGVGNHDRRDRFAEAYCDALGPDGYVQYAVDRGPLRIVMLDTLDEGREGGAFCAARADWLQATLAEQPERPTLIALHHPPLPTGVPWMDVNTDAAWTRRLQAVVERHGQVIALVAGHIHRAIATTFAGRPLLTAGSIALPIWPDATPIDAPDGRPLIVDAPPRFAFHRWDGERLVTDFEEQGDRWPAIRHDERHRDMIRRLMAEPPGD